MLRFLIKPRRTEKTTELIRVVRDHLRESPTNHATVVCLNQACVNHFQEMGGPITKRVQYYVCSRFPNHLSCDLLIVDEAFFMDETKLGAILADRNYNKCLVASTPLDQDPPAWFVQLNQEFSDVDWPPPNYRVRIVRGRAHIVYDDDDDDV